MVVGVLTPGRGHVVASVLSKPFCFPIEASFMHSLQFMVEFGPCTGNFTVRDHKVGQQSLVLLQPQQDHVSFHAIANYEQIRNTDNFLMRLLLKKKKLIPCTGWL